MINLKILGELEELIPKGERSDFVNHALHEALKLFGRKKAFEALEHFKQEHPLKMSTQEIIATKNEGWS